MNKRNPYHPFKNNMWEGRGFFFRFKPEDVNFLT